MSHPSFTLVLLAALCSCSAPSPRDLPVSTASVTKVLAADPRAADNYADYVAAAGRDRFYVAGTHRSTVFRWGEHEVYRGLSGQDAYFGKFDSDGANLWLLNIDGAGFYHPRGIAVDPADTLYAIALYDADCRVGPSTDVTITPGSHQESFVAKFDPSGGLRWLERFTGRLAALTDIAIDRSGAIVCAGNFSGELTIQSSDGGTRSLPAYGDRNIVVARFRPDGVLEWARSYGVHNEADAVLAIDPFDNIYLAGNYADEVTIGDFTASSSLAHDAPNVFISKLDREGAPQWLRTSTGSSGHAFPFGAMCDGLGNAYVLGSYLGDVQFDAERVVASVDDAFLVKMSGAGDALGMISFGNGDLLSPGRIDRGINDQILVTGHFRRSMRISSSTTTYTAADPSAQLFVANLNTDLVPVWVDVSTGSGTEYGYDVAGGGKTIGVVGGFEGAFRYGAFVLDSRSMSSFLAFRSY